LNNKLWPGTSPKVYFYDLDRFYVCMEFLVGFSNIKEHLIKGNKNDNFVPIIGNYLAEKAFETSTYKLDSKQHEELMNKFDGNLVTRDLVDYLNFRGLYQMDISKRPEELREILNEIQKSEEIKKLLDELEKEMKKKEEVVHGDFHTGSVLVKDDKVYIIDADACCSGPIIYDLGIFVGNVIESYCFQPFFEGDRKEYKKWVLSLVHEIWDTFEKKFNELTKEKSNFLRSAIGWTGVILLRSVVDPFSWPEFSHIKEGDKARVSLYILKVSKLILTQTFKSMKSMCEEIESIKY